MPHFYSWTNEFFFSPFLNFQHLHMNWIIHFECVKSIIHKCILHLLQFFEMNVQKFGSFHIYI